MIVTHLAVPVRSVWCRWLSSPVAACPAPRRLSQDGPCLALGKVAPLHDVIEKLAMGSKLQDKGFELQDYGSGEELPVCGWLHRMAGMASLEKCAGDGML